MRGLLVRPKLDGSRASGPCTPCERWTALDKLRALAVVLMIQGHTFAALLRADQMPVGIRHLHSVLHGLTAPAFLYGAGLAFGTATYARYGEHRAIGSALQRRLWRYLMLVLLGYALQLPGGSLWAAVRAQGDQLTLMCRVGPLQLIGVTLGFCQLAVLALSTPRRHATVAAALGGVVMLGATPIAQTGLAAAASPFLGSFLDDRGGSNFPIFPWSAFVLLGIGSAGVLYHQERLRRALPFVSIGALSALCAYTVFRQAAAQHEEGWLWRTSPSYLVFRLGLVVLLLGMLHLGHLGSAQAEPRAAWSSLLAKQSLAAYVVHLLLLYGTPLTPNVALAYGKSLSLAQTSVACGLMLVATLAITRLWDWLEHRQLVAPRHKRAGLALFALSMLLR
jgi:acyltransferase